jgi:CheY-like chemotaxis protein
VGEELAWLKDIPLDAPAELEGTLSEVLELVRPLAEQHRARLEVSLAEDLPDLAVHPAAARHLLLHLVSMLLPRAACGRVCVSARALRWNVEVRMQGQAHGEVSPARADQASLDMAYQLAELCGGELHLAVGGAKSEVALTLPALEQLPVLAIDDNADTLQLLHRFTAGTRYRLVGTRAPAQALELVAQCSPQVIVLDVMMPQVDGWKVLAHLRQHPLTCETPIVICTILPQEPLAFSLGASGFVRKPLTQDSFLAALDHQVAQLGPGRR